MQTWAVCLYVQGGEKDGEYIMEFPTASNQAEAISNAIDLNEASPMVNFQAVCAERVPHV